MRHVRTCAGFAVALAVLVPVVPATAAGPKPIAIVGGAAATEVRMTPRGLGVRAGATTFLVRNRTGRQLRVRVHYLREGPGVRARISARSAKGLMSGRADGARGLSVPIAARDSVALRLQLEARGLPTERAGGRLLLAPERDGARAIASGRSIAAPIVVPVAAVRREERETIVEPQELALLAELGVPGNASAAEPEASIVVRGAGVEALMGLPVPWPAAVLRDGDGRTLRVDITQMREGVEGTVFATVEATRPPEAGHYEGVIRFGGGAQALTIEVALDARAWFWWIVVLITLGVFLGQLLPLVLRRTRSRQYLAARTRRRIRQFAAVRRRSTEVASYPMDGVVGRWAWRPRDAHLDAGDDTARDLLRDIRAARTDPEFDEAKAAVDVFVRRIDRWCQIEAAAQPLAELLATELPTRHGKSWITLQAFDDAHCLLAAVRHEGADKPKAHVVRLKDGTELLMLATSIWQRAADHKVALEHPDPLWPAPWNPKDEAATQRLLVDLRREDRRLAELGGKGKRRSRGTWQPGAASPRRERWAARSWRRAVRHVLALPTHLAVTLTTGLEVFSTMLAIAVPSAVYAIAVYGDTWGSTQDMVVAFAAGFLGKVSIDLAGLAINRSRRGAAERVITEAAKPEEQTTPERNGGTETAKATSK
jgi:hypothetical protein